MNSIRRISAVSAAAAVLCTGAVLTASPAQAATTYNIMFVGTKIPDGVHSIKAGIGGEGGAGTCITNLQKGQDRNTGMTATTRPDQNVIFYGEFYGDSHCGDNSYRGDVNRTLPSNLSTKNWWISLS